MVAAQRQAGENGAWTTGRQLCRHRGRRPEAVSSIPSVDRATKRIEDEQCRLSICLNEARCRVEDLTSRTTGRNADCEWSDHTSIARIEFGNAVYLRGYPKRGARAERNTPGIF